MHRCFLRGWSDGGQRTAAGRAPGLTAVSVETPQPDRDPSQQEELGGDPAEETAVAPPTEPAVAPPTEPTVNGAGSLSAGLWWLVGLLPGGFSAACGQLFFFWGGGGGTDQRDQRPATANHTAASSGNESSTAPTLERLAAKAPQNKEKSTSKRRKQRVKNSQIKVT